MSLLRGGLAALLLVANSVAHAAAWLADFEKYYHFNALHYYESARFVDTEGAATNQPAYRKFESINLFEYGVSETQTVGIKYGYLYAKQLSTVSKGLTDPEFLARFKLSENNNTVFSIQPLVKVPLDRSPDDQSITTGEYDLELRLLRGRSYSVNRPRFINVEGAYYLRGGELPDELKFDIAVGIQAKPHMMVLGQLFSRISIGHELLGIGSSNPSDFYSQKLELSVVERLDERTSLQFGIYGETFIENSARGIAGFVSVWSTF